MRFWVGYNIWGTFLSSFHRNIKRYASRPLRTRKVLKHNRNWTFTFAPRNYVPVVRIIWQYVVFNVVVVVLQQVYLFTRPAELRDDHCPSCLSRAYTHPDPDTSATHGGGNTHTWNRSHRLAHRTGHPQNLIWETATCRRWRGPTCGDTIPSGRSVSILHNII